MLLPTYFKMKVTRVLKAQRPTILEIQPGWNIVKHEVNQVATSVQTRNIMQILELLSPLLQHFLMHYIGFS
jgi:hypothetical protein